MSERRLSMDELEMIRALKTSSEWVGDERIGEAKSKFHQARVKTIMEYFTDLACEHAWVQAFSNYPTMRRCPHCKTIRFEDEIKKPHE